VSDIQTRFGAEGSAGGRELNVLSIMELKAEKRGIVGSKVAALRKMGLVPAELYGNGCANEHLTVNEKEFARVFRAAGESTVISLMVDGKKVPALIYDVDKDPVSDKVLHVDFYLVNMNEEIETKVALEFAGEAPAVKTEGGVLVKSMQEVEVRALPADLPHSIEVDLSKLVNIHDSVYVKDLAVKSGVKVLADADAVVATIVEQAVEEETAAPVSVEDVKVEGEEKKKAESEKES